MKNVPHWQFFMVLYLVLVAVPVMIVHNWMKKKLLADKTLINLLLYFAAMAGTAFLMHILVMLLYFKFLFTH